MVIIERLRKLEILLEKFAQIMHEMSSLSPWTLQDRDQKLIFSHFLTFLQVFMKYQRNMKWKFCSSKSHVNYMSL